LKLQVPYPSRKKERNKRSFVEDFKIESNYIIIMNYSFFLCIKFLNLEKKPSLKEGLLKISSLQYCGLYMVRQESASTLNKWIIIYFQKISLFIKNLLILLIFNFIKFLLKFLFVTIVYYEIATWSSEIIIHICIPGDNLDGFQHLNKLHIFISIFNGLIKLTLG
jgi:hypothetical protein